MRFKVSAIILVILLTMILAVPTSALVATSPGINVLNLPEPQIARIDSAKGIVHLTVSVDPDASADFRASVTVTDGDGNVMEVSPQIAVDDPDDIKIPVRTVMAVGYKITPEISNNDIKSVGEDGVHSNSQTGVASVSGGRVKTRTTYIVTETAPDKIIVEKFIAADKPESTAVPQRVTTEIENAPESSANNQRSTASQPAPSSHEEIQVAQPIPAQDASGNSHLAIGLVMVIILSTLAGAIASRGINKRRKTRRKGGTSVIIEPICVEPVSRDLFSVNNMFLGNYMCCPACDKTLDREHRPDCCPGCGMALVWGNTDEL